MAYGMWHKCMKLFCPYEFCNEGTFRFCLGQLHSFIWHGMDGWQFQHRVTERFPASDGPNSIPIWCYLLHLIKLSMRKWEKSSKAIKFQSVWWFHRHCFSIVHTTAKQEFHFSEQEKPFCKFPKNCCIVYIHYLPWQLLNIQLEPAFRKCKLIFAIWIFSFIIFTILFIHFPCARLPFTQNKLKHSRLVPCRSSSHLRSKHRLLLQITKLHLVLFWY